MKWFRLEMLVDSRKGLSQQKIGIRKLKNTIFKTSGVDSKSIKRLYIFGPKIISLRHTQVLTAFELKNFSTNRKFQN